MNKGEKVIKLPRGNAWPQRWQFIDEILGSWVNIHAAGQDGWVFSPYIGYNLGISSIICGFSIEIYCKTNKTVKAPMLWVCQNGYIRVAHEDKDAEFLAGLSAINILQRNGMPVDTLGNIRRNTDGMRMPALAGGEQLVAEGELQGFPDLPWDSLSRFGIAGDYNLKIAFEEIEVSDEQKRAMLQAGTGYVIRNKGKFFWDEQGVLPKWEIFLPEGASHQGLLNNQTGDIYVFSTLVHYSNPNQRSSNTTSMFLVMRFQGNTLPELILVVPRAIGGDGTETESFQGLTDLNSDGIPELWTSVIGYEWWYFCGYELRESGAVEIFRGGGGGL